MYFLIRSKATSLCLGVKRVRNYVSASTSKVSSLDEWIASPPKLTLTDTLNLEHTSDLFVTLPTRDGTRKPYEAPRNGSPLPYGHHLAFFHARTAESQLREDGTDEEISPPAPFLQRMWAGGKISWDISIPLLVGVNTAASSTVVVTEKKGFEKGKPLVFVTQKIDFTMDGKTKPSVVEERQHVYLPEARETRRTSRDVAGIPTMPDFSLQYRPTPVTLFRFSALMFNAHHIHLDKEYSQKIEGHPERLVHGPLTAMMLLETVAFHYPMAHIQQFEYRATNPLFVSRDVTINGVWTDSSTAILWCVDNDGVVGMTGTVRLAQ